MCRFLHFSIVPAILLTAAPAFAEARVVSGEAARLDQLWILLCTVLVFLMQAGFLCFEVGSVRPRNGTSVALKNVIDWVAISVAFFTVGFGLMFGASWNGWLGTSGFALGGLAGDGSALTFYLFQLAFAGTALTIVSGAMAERTGLVTYLCASIAIGLLIYPVFGHWVWGDVLLNGDAPWLAALGFRDFAGASVVHLVGGCVGLVGIAMLGPRLGRFGTDGKPVVIENANLPMMALGTFVLWLGWFGFNGGSALALDASVPLILLNTNLAAAFAGLTALAFSTLTRDRENVPTSMMGGILGGLVAITACCNVVTPAAAAAVGLFAGVIYAAGNRWLAHRFGLDDPVGAVAIHGGCGAFGVLAVALFGQAEQLPLGRLEQLGVQALGVFVCAAWSCTAAWLLFSALRRTVGLRVSLEQEQRGIDLTEELLPVPPRANPGREAPVDDEILELL